MSKKVESIEVRLGGELIKLKRNRYGVFQGKYGLCVARDLDSYEAYLRDDDLFSYEGSGKRPQTAVNRLERKLGTIYAKLDKLLFGGFE